MDEITSYSKEVEIFLINAGFTFTKKFENKRNEFIKGEATLNEISYKIYVFNNETVFDAMYNFESNFLFFKWSAVSPKG